MPYTSTGIAYDRAGPRTGATLLLLHAGVADRRMWQPQWPALTAERDVLRIDLRGFGESATPPRDALSPVDDVLDTVDELGIEHCHLVGTSFGAGVAAEFALSRPEAVHSLLLSAPGGALLAELTEDLRAFLDAERTALADNDIDAAVEANLTWWVDGPRRQPGAVDQTVREPVGRMQRRTFEVTEAWGEVAETELDPPALDRLGEIGAPTLVLLGGLDLDTVQDAARRVTDGVPGARRVDWPDVAHLPSLEQPERFLTLLREWLP